MAVGVGQPMGIAVDLWAQGLERIAEPVLRLQITAQASRDQHAAQKPAAGQARVQLFDPLLKQFSLGLADLERRRVGKVAEIVKVVVEPLQLRQQHAQPLGTRRHGASGGRLDGLAVGEGMRQTADAGYSLGQHYSRTRYQALEPLFHTAMLEEQAWLVVQDR